jgi:hypothetical protein
MAKSSMQRRRTLGGDVRGVHTRLQRDQLVGPSFKCVTLLINEVALLVYRHEPVQRVIEAALCRNRAHAELGEVRTHRRSKVVRADRAR